MAKRDREGSSAPQGDVTDPRGQEPQETDPSVEGKTNLESPERIRDTRKALEELVVNGAGHAKPFRRDIEVFKMDPPTNPYADPRDPGGGWYEHWALEDRGMDKDLKTIELRTFPDEDNPDSAYHMQVVFSLTEDGAPDLSKPLMLSVESPFDLAPLQGMSTGAIDAPKAGAFAEGRHVEDYLYVSDSKTLHGRREGFTVLNVGSRLRSLGNGVSYEATSTQMDPILEIAKDAYVGGKDGPKAAELSPGLEDLVV